MLELLAFWVSREHPKSELRVFADHPGGKSLSAQLKPPAGGPSAGPALPPQDCGLREGPLALVPWMHGQVEGGEAVPSVLCRNIFEGKQLILLYDIILIT